MLCGSVKIYDKEVAPLLGKAAVDRARAMGSDIPVALHLDHGPNLEAVKICIDSGFSSVMIDGSHYSFEENIAITKEVVEYAKNLTFQLKLNLEF